MTNQGSGDASEVQPWPTQFVQPQPWTSVGPVHQILGPIHATVGATVTASLNPDKLHSNTSWLLSGATSYDW